MLRLTTRRLFVGQRPLLRKSPVIRYVIYFGEIGPEVATAPLRTGFVTFRIRPHECQWGADRVTMRPAGSGGLSGIPERIVIAVSGEGLAELRRLLGSGKY